MRRAFGLMQALTLILLMGGLLTLTLRYVRTGVHHTADSFNREEAELFLRSATEIALLQIAGYDRGGGGCLRRIEVFSSNGKWRADVAVVRYYVYPNGEDNLSNCPVRYAVETEESHGMVMLEIAVEGNGSRVDRPIRIVRRTLQRP